MTLAPTTRASLLLRLCNPADHEAWVEFVSLYEPVIYRVLRRAGLQEADALEVKCGLLCPGLIVLKANNKEWVWDSAMPGELKGYFAAAVQDGKALSPVAELTSDNDFPANFLILDTRTHRRGVLQIAGVTEHSPGVKIRYRLVEGAPVKKISPAK